MRKVNAYMTVEASLIMSMVLVILLFLIRYSLWIYDRCILEQDMAVLLLKYSVSGGELTWQQVCSEWEEEAYIWIKPETPVIQQKGSTLQLTERAEGGQLEEVTVQYELQQISCLQWLRLKRKLEQSIDTTRGEEG